LHKVLDHTYIALTVGLTLYSQLIIRWQVGQAGTIENSAYGSVWYVFTLIMSPWVLSSLAATFLAGVCWILTMTKFELSYAYPFIALNYVLVGFAAVILFGESLTGAKVVGTALVVAGIVVISWSPS